MVRGKIQMKRIESTTNRQVTFSKRRNGLLKKAYELSVLCDAEVAVIIFSQNGKLYEFSSNDVQKTIQRYHKHAREVQINKYEVEQYMQELKLENANMAKKIELLEASKRKLLGHGLSSCSIEELQEVDGQLERSLHSIRARKAHLFTEKIGQLKEKERLLLEENAKLCEKEMVRGKIQMKRIENATNRQVTFSKRRNGLLKKAYELSVLCDAEVAMIIFSQKGKLYEFSSNDMQKAIQRYHKHAREVQINKYEVEQHMQQLKLESANMAKKIELLEASQWKILGHGLSSCSIEELQEVDGQLERSLRSIRERKAQLFTEKIGQLKEKEKLLLEENAKLCEKNIPSSQIKHIRMELECRAKPWQPSLVQEKVAATHCSKGSLQNSEVETELFIGLPEVRC